MRRLSARVSAAALGLVLLALLLPGVASAQGEIWLETPSPNEEEWIGPDRPFNFDCYSFSEWYWECKGSIDGRPAEWGTDLATFAGSEGRHTAKAELIGDPENDPFYDSDEAVFHVDVTPPANRFTSPSAGQSVEQNGSLQLDFPCTGVGAPAGCDVFIDENYVEYPELDGNVTGSLPTKVVGEHTIRIYGTDAAGNEATTTRKYTVVAAAPSDLSAPVVTVTAPTADQWVKKGGSLISDFACTEETGGSGLDSCAGKVGTTAVADGNSVPTGTSGRHTLRVTGRDKASNEAFVDRTYRVDGANPTVQVLRAGQPWGTPWVAPGATLQAHFACADPEEAGIAGSGIETCAGKVDGVQVVESGDDLPTSDEGLHALLASATDLVGNQGTENVTYGVDGTDPTISFGTPADSIVGLGGELTGSFSCDDTHSGIASCTAAVDGQPFASGDDLPAAAGGTHTLQVTAVDEVGRSRSSSLTYAVDADDPTATIDAPAGTGTVFRKDGAATAAFDCTDATSSITSCAAKVKRCDGACGTAVTVLDGEALPTGEEGRWLVELTAVDAAGRTASVSSEYWVDSTPPDVTITTPSDGQAVPIGAPLAADFACADMLDAVQATSCTGKLDGAAIADGGAISTAANATRTLEVRGEDHGGLSATRSVRFYVGPPRASGRPGLSGPSRATGDRLTATPVAWDRPGTASHQWQRCNAAGTVCGAIAGANGESYTVEADDIGKRLRVRVTMTNAAGAGRSDSLMTGVIGVPVATTRPAVSGAVRIGSTLQRTLGVWDPAESRPLEWRWQRCNADGGGCTDVTDPAGAGETFVLTEADRGKRLRVRVKATNAAGAATAYSPLTLTVGKPVNGGLPVVTGGSVAGDVLHATTGTWDGSPTYRYRWLRCNEAGLRCAAIPGDDADGADYATTADDEGSRLRVEVTATNGAGSTTARSAATRAIGLPYSTVWPVVSGRRVVGETLSVTTGTWRPAATEPYEYQWQRCNVAVTSCTAIGGASAPAYLLQPADEGQRVRAVVRATNDVGTGSVVSYATANVGAPLNTARPSLTGTPALMSVTDGTWNPAPTQPVTYQWRHCSTGGTGCADIAGATASSYAPSRLSGRRLQVVVRATNAAGSTTQTSNLSSTLP